MIKAEQLLQARTEMVAASLREDIGEGDITASLIPATQNARARVITREACVVAGREWVEEVFRQLDSRVHLTWNVTDGDKTGADSILFELEGSARSLLTGERAALNWLQTLSGVATACAGYASMVAHTGARLLDTRKTIPGLRAHRNVFRAHQLAPGQQVGVSQ